MSQNARILTISDTVTVTNGTTNGSKTVYLNGLVRAIYVNAPDLTGTNTYTFAILGPNTGQSLFSKASLTENTQSNIVADANNYPLQVPVDGNCVIKITSSGTEGADRAFSFSLLIDRG